MFIVYKSNNLNTLLSKVCKIIVKKPLYNIFQKEIFINENKVLFQYINIFIANKIGISANFKLYHPSNFIWKLFNIVLPVNNIKNFFTRSSMIFMIMKLIDKNFCFKDITQKNRTIKKFKFAFLMAEIFQQYLIYRPNWINMWEQGQDTENISQHDKWQIELWNKLIFYNKKHNSECLHFANAFFLFNSLIKTKKIKKKCIPSRCFIFSSFALNPCYIKIFKKISMYTDVYLFHMTPFENSIFACKLPKDSRQLLKKDANNSLVQLWGKYEKIYSYYIFNYKYLKLINCFKKVQKLNILNNIQNDILRNKNNEKKRVIYLKDNSISINICFNKHNEIEVLHKTLLVFLNQNKDISPGDIVVTSTNIDDYVPYINSVFKSIENEKKIPFFISKKYSKTTKIILSIFNKILNLSNSRFNNEEILELLDIPEIAKKFNISEDEIDILYRWIEQANIRWAIDKKHKKDLGLPENHENTWLYGIKKLFLSYSMNDKKSIWNNILSCTYINNSQSELIGKLFEFINILNKWRKKLLRSQFLVYWTSLSESLMHDFVYENKKTKKSIEIINKTWIKMINDSLLSNYKKRISIDILKKNFFYIIKNINPQKFSPGVINFCYTNSVYCIPFKIICIIGANNQSSEKKNNIDDFNLLNVHPLVGDYDIQKKKYYLFLQSIVCAQNFFYMSYVGYSINNDIEKRPSIFIDQLFNYIALNFYLKNHDCLNMIQNKKKIFNHFFKKQKKEFFYKKIYIFKKTSLEFNNKKSIKQHEYKINLTELINFWKNPIRYFFNMQLNIKLNCNNRNINTTEPFQINALDRFLINTILLNKIIKNKDITEIYKHYNLSGILPYNLFGKIFLKKQTKEMRKIAVLASHFMDHSEEKKFNLKIQKYQLFGVLSEVQKTGLLRWKSNIINHKDQISLWLEHLVYCAIGGLGESKIIGKKNKMLFFSSLHANLAKSYLSNYITGYIKGTQKPLLLTKSGTIWINQVYDTKKKCMSDQDDIKKKGYAKLLQTWQGNNFYQGEKEDFYIRNAILELNTQKICTVAEKWLTPMLNHKNNRNN